MQGIELEDYKTASHCPVSWSEMVGDEVARTCLQCERQVYDLSNMSREEGLATIQAHQERGEALCVKYFLRRDGKIMTEDCPPGLRRKLRRKALQLAGFLASAFSLTTFVGCGPAPQPSGKGSQRKGAPVGSASVGGAGSAAVGTEAETAPRPEGKSPRAKRLPQAR